MKNNNKGVTLVEVLISLSMITIIVVAMFSSMNNVIRVNLKNDVDVDSRTVLNTVIENVTAYVRQNGMVGIKGNNGHYIREIENNEEIIFYVNQIDVSDKIEYFDKLQSGETDFKITLDKVSDKEYNQGPYNKAGKHLYTVSIKIEPLKGSERVQEITKKIYGPIE